MFHRILVALDNSESSQQLFKAAVILAKKTQAHLMLLHVLTASEDYPEFPMYARYENYAPLVYEQAVRQYMEHSAALERKAVERLQSLATEANASGVTTEFIQDSGDPGYTICAIARNWNADVILMGRRSRAKLNELFLGSVSNYIVHHAPCSVLVIQHSSVPQLEEQPHQLASV